MNGRGEMNVGYNIQELRSQFNHYIDHIVMITWLDIHFEIFSSSHRPMIRIHSLVSQELEHAY